MSSDELKEFMAETARQMRETSREIRETSKEIRELKISQAKTDEQMKESDRKLTKVGRLLGNIGQNQGDVAEEFFYNSLKDDKKVAGIVYDNINKNLNREVGKLKGEYDIVLINGRDIAIIETKYKLNEKDLDKLLTKQYPDFQKLYPEYANYNHHLGLASFYIDDKLKNEALEKGVIILQRKGDVIDTFIPKHYPPSKNK